jgi:hypothetical protein
MNAIFQHFVYYYILVWPPATYLSSDITANNEVWKMINLVSGTSTFRCIGKHAALRTLVVNENWLVCCYV